MFFFFFVLCSIPRVCSWCEKNGQWKELTFLHVHYDEFDKAIQIMMQHSADAWDHVLFKETIAKCVNVENYYRAVRFYLEEHPSLATDLLQSLVRKKKKKKKKKKYNAKFFLQPQNFDLFFWIIFLQVQKVDHARVVSVVEGLGHLPLIKPYLVAVQSSNVTAVNDALNSLLIEEEVRKKQKAKKP